ncbi:MAG: hypothetical protein ACKV2O_01960 [Acidimicrobiales bacterium]
MSWLALALEALLVAPALALLGLGFGVGDRFGVPMSLWPGATAVVGAVLGEGLASRTGVSPLLALMVVVPLVFALVFGLGLVLTSRPDLGNDPVRHSAASVLVAAAALAVVVLWRGDGPLPMLAGDQPSLTILSGPTISRASLISAAAGLLAIGVLGAILQVRRVRVRLAVLGRAPELLTVSGHDQRKVSAAFGALTACCGAVAGVLLARHQTLTPLSAVGLSVVGVEVALLGVSGSFAGALGAGAALSLVGAMGNEFRDGWGTLAGHLLVVAVLSAQPLRWRRAALLGGGS